MVHEIFSFTGRLLFKRAQITWRCGLFPDAARLSGKQNKPEQGRPNMAYAAPSILIVEDEEAHAELIRRAIRKTDRANRIDVVNDGEQALDYIFNRGEYSDPQQYPRPALVLLDIKLPGVDGFEVLKRIKGDRALKMIPVIMLTTSDCEQDIMLAYHHHANSYLTKPVGFAAFEEKVLQLGRYWTGINEPPPWCRS